MRECFVSTIDIRGQFCADYAQLFKTLCIKGHPNVITRILKDLARRELVESYKISGKKRTYALTKRGDLARQVLNNLIEPKTLPCLLKHLKTHRNVIISIMKQLMHIGFITLFKTINPTRKIYSLTQKGETIIEKLEYPEKNMETQMLWDLSFRKERSRLRR